MHRSCLWMSWCIICVHAVCILFLPVVFRHGLRIWSEWFWGPRDDIKHHNCPSGCSLLPSFSTFHSPLMRTPPNYFSGWSAGTQPELDPPCARTWLLCWWRQGINNLGSSLNAGVRRKRYIWVRDYILKAQPELPTALLESTKGCVCCKQLTYLCLLEFLLLFLWSQICV